MNQVIPDPVQTTLAPGATAQAIIAPEPTSRWQALRKIGWWKGSDYMMLFFLGLHMLAGIFCMLFSKPSFNGLLI